MINLQHGGPSPTGADLAVDRAEDQVLLLPQVAPSNRPRTLKNLNDNCCVAHVGQNPQIDCVQSVQKQKSQCKPGSLKRET